MSPFLLMLFSVAAQAAPFGIVPVQGELADDMDVPLDRDVSITFELWADDAATAPDWEETLTVSVDHGAFTSYLGSDVPLDLAWFRDHPQGLLSMTVDGDVLSPVPLAYTPLAAYAELAGHAATAGDAETLGGMGPDDFLPFDWQPDWSDLTGVPADLADGDADTTYLAGEGVLLQGNTLSGDADWVRNICLDTEDELTALLDDNYLAADALDPGVLDGDDDTTYSAGNGLRLSGTTFSVDESDLRTLLDDDYLAVDRATIEGWARGVCYDTEDELTVLLDDNYLPSTYRPNWADLRNVPPDLADGDDDTRYAAGSGLNLSATTFSLDDAAVSAIVSDVAYDTEAELTAALDDNYLPADHVVDWDDIDNKPAGLDDGDDDTRYTAGVGLNLSGTQFSADPTWVDGRAVAAADDSNLFLEQSGQLRAYPSKMYIYMDGNGFVNFTNYHGQTSTWDPSAMPVTGGTIIAGGIAAVSNGVDDYRLYFNIQGAPSIACTLLHSEDDRARPGWYFATDGGNNVADVWGVDGIDTFILAREDISTFPIPNAATFYIMCF